MIYFNGKCFAQPLTGVQRYAIELLQSMDAVLDSGEWLANDRFTLLVPDAVMQPLPDFKCIEIRKIASGNLHFWEQIRLPLAARGSTLINFSGSAPLLKTGQVCTFHDAAIFDAPSSLSPSFVRWYRLLFRIQSKLSCRLLTVSAFSKDRLGHHLAISPSKIGVVHCGADHMRLQPADPSVLTRMGVESGRFFFAIGSASPNKNFARLIEAFSGLHDPSTRLVVAGGSNAAVFAHSADAVRKDRRIIRAGRLTDDEIKALYSHARAYVFPSTYEGFGLPPIEAMSCNCPVLAAHAASIPEICGPAAAYFDPLSVDAIREALARALVDDAWLEELRHRGRQRAEMFTWHNAAISLMNELTKLGVVRRSMAPPVSQRARSLPA
jgi:glycosyltransferase involved in cell wall biosynthesis